MALIRLTLKSTDTALLSSQLKFENKTENTKIQTTTTRDTTNSRKMTSYGNYGMKLTKSNHLYRNTKVGVALFDTIQELFELKKLTPQQALIIVAQFDNSIRKIMNKKIEENHSFFSFEAEVKAYRLQSGWCSIGKS